MGWCSWAFYTNPRNFPHFLMLFLTCSFFRFLFRPNSFICLPIDFLLSTLHQNPQVFCFVAYSFYFFKVWECLAACLVIILCKLYSKVKLSEPNCVDEDSRLVSHSRAAGSVRVYELHAFLRGKPQEEEGGDFLLSHCSSHTTSRLNRPAPAHFLISHVQSSLAKAQFRSHFSQSMAGCLDLDDL